MASDEKRRKRDLPFAKEDIAGKELKYIEQHMPNKDRLGFGIRKMSKGDGATKALCVLQSKLFSIYFPFKTIFKVFQDIEI